MQAAAAVAQAYDLDDLDDEWKALLNELEDRLLQVTLCVLHPDNPQMYAHLALWPCQVHVTRPHHASPYWHCHPGQALHCHSTLSCQYIGFYFSRG